MVSPTWETLKDFCPPKPKYLPQDYPDLTGKVALVTGSNTGVGYESAKALLKQNATVLFVNRNMEKTKGAIERIKKELANVESLDEKIHLINADLGDLSSIKPAVDQIIKSKIDKIHYTILNAGVMSPPNGSKTKQGYELQIGTNVLGHHLLQELLTPLVLNAVTPDFNPRVVWLTSSAHLYSYPKGGINWDSFHDASNSGSMMSYGQSKTGNIYQAYIYGKLHKDDGIISVAVHPGYLNSELQRSYGSLQQYILKKFLYPAVYGSYTELYGALSSDVTLENNGRYIGPWGEFRELRDDIQKGLSDGTAQKFWDWASKEVEPYL
ncbi:hypothetical protein WICANDRAFT_48591 [Wickerhamomyces anomalus NRRL Y-366-8]|uniref:Uncharacterized protein n=1 Tax=Wickerhamomyces anomalus (strain ATCC 58044 / CBS 1984 / NCYC 433 / NRRL Y-366-8) TaxID=683960 RepID=A0A1E3P9K1_WICAA|nr:uncharacterized protein WICANDRAFT_48591 [Wickerhamomyces anomalus NRRL Y-366-8]ODQ61632.1 hypothetical protein WICANDRAFT_48591 [Wickerhamomyces anomalus NRRL Y-366-8]